jgi:hypothetical protein
MTGTLSVVGTLLAADVPARTIRGLLLPYGPAGRTSAGRVTAAAGSLTIPPDVGTVRLNVEHDYTRPVGRASGFTDQADGLHASFLVASTRAGDDLLEEVREGLRTCLSVEVEHPVIRDGRLLGGQLTAAAAVVRPAFAGAEVYALTAADVGELPADAVTQVHDQLTQALAVLDDQTVTDTPTPTDNPPEDSTVTTSTVTAAAPRGLGTLTAADPEPTYRDVLTLAATARRTGDPTLLAALADVTVSGTGGIGGDVTTPAWLGELWGGRTYERRYVPLIGNLPLTGRKAIGWRWVTPPEVAPYAGNKGPVPSNAVDTEQVEQTAQALAGAHDVDRSFRDFNDTAFWDAYFRAMTESYAVQSDDAALAGLIGGATDVTGGGTAADTDVWTLIVDGALAVIDGRGQPSFAVIGSDLYRDALLTPKEQVLAILSSGFGLESGQVAGFTILPSADPALTGKALVGAKEAATFYELPGSPIRVEGLDITRAGVDPLVIGYYAEIVNKPETLALVSAPIAAATGARTNGK